MLRNSGSTLAVGSNLGEDTLFLRAIDEHLWFQIALANNLWRVQPHVIPSGCRVEGVIVSGIGLVIGFCLGWLISLILIHVVNPQSFHWSMELFAPWTALAGSAVLVLALSTLTAVAMGRQAMSKRAILAVKEDW